VKAGSYFPFFRGIAVSVNKSPALRAVVSWLALQLGQLLAAAGAAQGHSAVVVDDTAGETRKDRCEGDMALEICVLSTNRLPNSGE
jgi:hypothetical protein